MKRRRFLSLGGAALAQSLVWNAAQPLWAVPPTADPGFEQEAGRMVTPEIDAAIDRGLAALAERQNEDGTLGPGLYEQNVAVVGLTAMAWMASGSMPRGGRYSENVQRALDFVLANVSDSGYIRYRPGSSHGPMYGHGFATMFLAECHGAAGNEAAGTALSRAVRLIVDTQNDEGGWRYYPVRADADISVTVCQIMALRAARNVGIFVPTETVEKSIDYVKRSQNADGGFRYQLRDADSLFPRSAAGVVALYSAGIYEGEEIERGLAYLEEFTPRADATYAEQYFYYAHYYAAQAMWHAGGDYWRRWYPALGAAMIARQADDGTWADSLSPVYGTAMACLALQIPNNLLSIFQR